MEWRNLYRGFIMGVSDVVPGVSGGTIALVLGIYQQLIEAINGVFTKAWLRSIAFLLPLLLGVGTALYFFSSIIKWLLENYENQVLFLFIGLIIGVLPMLLAKSNYKQSFGTQHYALFALAAILIASMAFFQEASAPPTITTFSASTYLIIFLSGWLASTAMILPGISGSLLLLIVGMYPTFLYLISEVVIEGLIPLAMGIVTGLIIMSKIIRYFLHNYYYQTFALIIGLVVGSVFVIFPGFEAQMMMNLMSVLMLGVGLFAAYLLGKLEYKELKQ